MVWSVSLTYLALTIWMHLWALEAGLPRTDQPTKPHHQVCTWIGTSGDAWVAECSSLVRPMPIVSVGPAGPTLVPLLHVSPCTTQLRAPPVVS